MTHGQLLHKPRVFACAEYEIGIQWKVRSCCPVASGAELVLFRMWLVCAAPSTGQWEGGCPDLLLLSGGFLFVFSKFKVCNSSGTSQERTCPTFFVCKTAWLILSTLFRTLVIVHREGLIEFYFFQYKVKIVVC